MIKTRLILLIFFSICINIQNSFSTNSFAYLDASDSSKVISGKEKKSKKEMDLLLGTSYNTHGNLSLVVGIQTKRLSLRFDPGINFSRWNKNSENKFSYQFNLLYNIKYDKNTTQNLSFGVGNINYDQHTETYYGLFWDVNYYGFFFELGFPFKYTSAFVGLSPIMKLGYVFRFN